METDDKPFYFIKFNIYSNLSELLEKECSENFYFEFFDKWGRLVSVKKISSDCVDVVSADLQCYLDCLCDSQIRKVLVVHNHFHSPEPSANDILLMKVLEGIFDAANIELCGSIIVYRGKCYLMSRGD